MQINKLIHQFLKKWNLFWFESSRFDRLGLMRLLLGGTLFFLYSARQFRMDFYNENSFLPKAEALNIFPEYYRAIFSWCFWPDAWAGVIHFAFVILIFCFFIGWTNRLFMLITWVLAMGFIHRNYGVLFGADVIGALFLFYLSFTKCYQNYSVKNLFDKNLNEQSLFKRWQGRDLKQVDELSSVFYRLAQFQICAIYAYTGFEKLKGASWWNGSALWTVFANPQSVIFDMTWMRQFGLVISIITFVTIIFEIYFPMALFVPKLKKYWLGAGFLFHLGIGLLMGLLPFSLVMLSTYFLFFDLRFKNANFENK